MFHDERLTRSSILTFLTAGAIAAVMMVLMPGLASAQSPDDCYVCEWEEANGEVIPGTVGCEDAKKGEESWTNCLDDQHGTYCNAGMYPACEDPVEEEQEDLLVFVPTSSGSSGIAMEVTTAPWVCGVNGTSGWMVRAVILD